MIRPRRCNRGVAAWILALALLPTVLLPVAAAADGLTAHYFEELRPTVTQHAKGRAQLAFNAFGRGFRLELAPNPRLATIAAGSSARFYAGSIAGVPESWARISISDGATRGMIWDGRELLIVDAAPTAEGEVGAGATMIFRLSDAVLEPGVSLAGDTVRAPRDAAAAYRAFVDKLNVAALQSAVATERLEVSLLGDPAYVSRFGSEAQARDALLTRLNNVDGIFSSQLGVQLHIASVNLGDALTAGLTATTNSSALLDELGLLRQRTAALNSTGLTHLFTGRALDGNTAGIAYLDALCSSRFGVSLTMAHNNVTIDTLITAHEIGHVFGAPHDGADECAATPVGQFIMTPTVNTAITAFSACSLDTMRPVIASATCLVTLTPADLGLPASLGSQTAAAGADFPWQVSITNLGGSAASGARATFQVTPALTIASATTAGGNCVIQTGLATCDLPVIEAGAAQAVQLTLRTSAAGAFNLNAQVVLAGDANATNDTSAGTLTVSGTAPAPSPSPSPPSNGGGGGAVDPLWILLMLLLVYPGPVLLKPWRASARRRA